MDIDALRYLTQSRDVNQLKANSTALIDTLKNVSAPVNEGSRWGFFMIGFSAACVIEGWVSHDLDSEKRSPCKDLVAAWCDFCTKASAGRWFVDDKSLVEMMDRILLLENQRLKEDGWVKDSFEHSYLYRYREYAFDNLELDGNFIFNLPTTPEG
jgi:hypothetical protein